MIKSYINVVSLFLFSALRTTNYNQSFRDSYTITTTNPDSSKYDPVAVNEFHRVCMALFGAAATSQPILYCHKATHCKNKNVYTGTPQALMTMLRGTCKVNEQVFMLVISKTEKGRLIADLVAE